MPKKNELYRDKKENEEDDDDFFFLEQNLQPIAQDYLYNLRNGIKVKKNDSKKPEKPSHDKETE